MAAPERLVQRGSPVNRIASSSASMEQLDSTEGKQRAYPIRTCLGCGTKSNKAELVRLAVSVGVLVVDGRQVLPGRGVYCCRNHQCYQRLVKQRKKLAWALRYHGTEKVGTLVISQGLDAEFTTILVV